MVEQRRLEKRCATQKEKVQYVLLEDFKTLPRLLRGQKSDYGGICCLNEDVVKRRRKGSHEETDLFLRDLREKFSVKV